MQTSVNTKKNIFQLDPQKDLKGMKIPKLTTGRYLIGRAESCEIIIPQSDISAVHAVIEVNASGMVVYDMNSRNGTFVNGERIVSKNIGLGESVMFGSIVFQLKKYNPTPDLPPVLKSLDPVTGPARIVNPDLAGSYEAKPSVNLPKNQPIVDKQEGENAPYIIYPLSTDPLSDNSEYIFEDADQLYPIFKYEVNKQAVEVIILFGDKVFSVDYLPEKNGVYKLAGVHQKGKNIEFPYLGKTEEFNFVEIKEKQVTVNKLHNYQLLHLKDKKVDEVTDGFISLDENDIIRLTNGNLEIYVRKISAPPKVKSAPVFGRDKDLLSYVFIAFLIVAIPVFALNFFEIDEKKDDAKDPERIATILYREQLKINTNKTVAKMEKKKPRKQKAPKKPVVKKTTPKKQQATSQKSEQKTAKKTNNPGTKSAAKVQKVKRVKNPAPKRNNQSKVVKTRSSSKTPKTSSASTAAKSNVAAKSQGRVETYKSFDFKSSVSSMMAKGGSLKSATVKNTVTGVTSSGVSGGVASNVEKANVGTEVGSLTGSTVGKLGESKGTEGLSTKTGVYTAGIPSETVVMGSMDPDVIRRILRDNIPFFRSCYQKELDRSSSSNVSGTIKLDFTIGASGHVSRAGVDGSSRLPANVKRCVIGVLRGIKFPKPMGGGTVDVKQPFNFYPKRI